MERAHAVQRFALMGCLPIAVARTRGPWPYADVVVATSRTGAIQFGPISSTKLPE